MVSTNVPHFATGGLPAIGGIHLWNAVLSTVVKDALRSFAAVVTC